MTKQNALTEMVRFERKLPFGAKAKIAKKLRENRHNITTAFRGIAGEKLTLRVYNKAKELYPSETRIIKRRVATSKS